MRWYYDLYKNDDCPENKNLLTNFAKQQRPIYQKAIDEYGCDELYISEDAYWRDGTKDNSLLSLRYKGDWCRDLTEFWRIFDKIYDKYDKHEDNVFVN